MPVSLDTQWCESCQRQAGHLQDRMLHTLHVLISILTIVWFLGWIVMALFRSHHPRHCIACGRPETTVIPPNHES